ncbi:MAG TPA: MFS transporter [Nitrososphaerales archaeon]|nr:MFS transporter [Nitrososphaerales archaeon]
MTGMEPDKKDGHGTGWFYSLLPVDVATGPVATLIQLYILELHGTVIDVGLAITLFNAVSIPAAIIWGYVTDRFQSRRTIIVLSSVAISGNLILLPLANSISGAALVYALFSLVSSVSATPANLLIMETQRKSRWASMFARFSMVSSVGNTLGLVLGAAWSVYLPVSLLVLPLSALSLASALLSFVMIKEPPISFEREFIVLQKRSLQQRLLAIPLVFLRTPNLVDFKAVFKGLRSALTRQLPLLYLSIFVFYLASGLFNTSFVPSLQAARLSASEVFVVALMAMVVQTASFYFAGPYVEKRDLRKSAIAGLLLRSGCYAIMGVLALFAGGLPYLAATLVLYPLAGGLAFSIYYTSSNTMIFNTLGVKNQGSRLGVYSALVGVATMLGSFISGYISFYFGFLATFVLAAVLLAVCAILVPAVSAHQAEAASPSGD